MLLRRRGNGSDVPLDIGPKPIQTNERPSATVSSAGNPADTRLVPATRVIIPFALNHTGVVKLAIMYPATLLSGQ